MEETRKRVLTGFQPSGMLTLGNYLGALKNCKEMQDEYDCLFMVADLHSITVRQEPAKLRSQIYTTCALFLAAGLDPEKSIMFIQSMVGAHAQMGWLLSCYTQFGELSRMTQFKDKSKKHADNVNAGLFTYPDLMAADILLYNPDFVPVGDDQRQHLELTRDVAERFNNIYGNVFRMPEAFFSKRGTRVMSLQDPTRKMSKSDDNPNSYISIIDTPEEIMRKFKRAVTDSEACVCVGEGRYGINNLIGIYSAVTGKTPEQIANEFEGQGYGVFKPAVAEAVIEELRPIRESFDYYMKDKKQLEEIFKAGAERAERIANRTVGKAMKKIGFVL